MADVKKSLDVLVGNDSQMATRNYDQRLPVRLLPFERRVLSLPTTMNNQEEQKHKQEEEEEEEYLNSVLMPTKKRTSLILGNADDHHRPPSTTGNADEQTRLVLGSNIYENSSLSWYTPQAAKFKRLRRTRRSPDEPLSLELTLGPPSQLYNKSSRKEEDRKYSSIKNSNTTSTSTLPRYDQDSKNPNHEKPPFRLNKRIREMGGKDPKFIIEKALNLTDMKKNNNRLSIPVRQVKSPDFLRGDEAERVKDRYAGHRVKMKGMDVKLVVDQNPTVYDLRLKEWKMTSSYTYNLVMKPGADGAVEEDKHAAKGWNKVVKENQLAVKDRVRVWSFRVNSRLYFALTKVVDDDDIIDIHDQVQVEEERMKIISTELKLSIN